MESALKFMDGVCQTEQICSNHKCGYFCQGLCARTIYSHKFFNPLFAVEKCFRNPDTLSKLPSSTYEVIVTYTLNGKDYKNTFYKTARTTFEAKELVCYELRKQGANIISCCCRE